MYRSWPVIALLATALGACASAQPPPAAGPGQPSPPQETAVPTPLPDGPLAPAIVSDTWLNTAPLQAADLHRRVVLIDFWTFG